MRLSSDSVVNSPPPPSEVVTSGSSSDLSWRRARLAAAFACLARSRSRLSKVVRRVANGTPSPDRERTAGTRYQRPPQAPGEHVVARPEHRTQRMLHLPVYAIRSRRWHQGPDVTEDRALCPVSGRYSTVRFSPSRSRAARHAGCADTTNASASAPATIRPIVAMENTASVATLASSATRRHTADPAATPSGTP